MFDLFSSMDFLSYSVLVPKVLVWVMGVFPLLWLSQCSSNWASLKVFLDFLVSLSSRLLTSGLTSSFSGLTLSCVGGFLFLFTSNLWGLFPGLFGISCQITFILFLSLCCWIPLNLSSASNKWFGYCSHLTPPGSPTVLVPMLNQIELISNFMRPLTLTLRLCMNMTTGHILLNLMNCGASFLVFTSPFLLVWLVFCVGFYYLFEVGVCVVQSCVYILLFSNYLEEHTS